MNHQTDLEELIDPKRPSRSSYPGGKNGMGVYQTIINHMPPHDVYIEPFVGGGAILQRKKPAGSNIAMDVDASALAALKKKYAGRTDTRFLMGCGVQFLKDFSFGGSQRVLIYADPPYMFETRSGQRDLYIREWTCSEHEAFLELMRSLPCMVMISGYESALYADLLDDWHLVTFTNITRGGPRSDCLWMNFPPPTALHDYRYLGENFRERERIKRKAQRWADNLAAMPELERRAVLSACLCSSSDPMT